MTVNEYLQARRVLVKEKMLRSKEILKVILDEEEKRWEGTTAKKNLRKEIAQQVRQKIAIRVQLYALTMDKLLRKFD